MSGLSSAKSAAQSTLVEPAPGAANQVNLVIATPCFGGQLSVVYAASLFKLQKLLLRRFADVKLKILFKDGDALITRARAILVTQFLDDPTRPISCSSTPISASNPSRCCA